MTQKSPSGPIPTTLSGYIFATKVHIDNQKKLVKQQYFPIFTIWWTSAHLRLRSFREFGAPQLLSTASASWRVTAQHVVVGVSETLRRWTDGATYVRQGDHHVGHWPTFLVHNDILPARVLVRCTGVGCRSPDRTSTTYTSLQFLAFFWSEVCFILLVIFSRSCIG